MDQYDTILALNTAIINERRRNAEANGLSPYELSSLDKEIGNLKRQLACAHNLSSPLSSLPWDPHALRLVARDDLFKDIAPHLMVNCRLVKRLFNEFHTVIHNYASDVEDQVEHEKLIPVKEVTRASLTEKYGSPPPLDVKHDSIRVEVGGYRSPPSPAYSGTYEGFHELIIGTSSVCIAIFAYGEPGISREKTLFFTFEVPSGSPAIPSVTLGFPFAEDGPQDRDVRYGLVQDAIATVLQWSDISEVDTILNAVDAIFFEPSPKRSRIA